MNSFFQKRKHSFIYAFAGVRYVLETQRNSWIHLFFTAAVIAAGILLKITALEWAVVLLCVCLVWVAELFNTALEAVADLACAEINPLAKTCKDVAAGAVLVAATVSVVIGVIIFGPPLFRLLFP